MSVNPMQPGHLVVELAAPFDGVATDNVKRKALEEKLLGLLDDLVLDLGLPLDPVVRVRAASGQATNVAPIRMSFNGRPLRIIRPTPSWPEKISELLTAIGTAIVDNRERFLSPELAQTIASRLDGQNGSGHAARLSGPALHSELSRFVRNGFSVKRAVRSLDDVLSDVEAARLAIFVHDPQSPAWAQWVERRDFLNSGLFYELGLAVPLVTPQMDPELGSEEFRIQINDVRLPPIQGLLPDEILVNDSAQRVNESAKGLLQTPARDAASPVTGRMIFSIARGDDAVVKKLEGDRLTTWNPLGYLILCVAIEIRRHAAGLLTTATVRHMLNAVERVYPELVSAARARLSVSWLREVLARLLEEGMSVRDLRGILESILSVNGPAQVKGATRMIFFPRPTNVRLVSSAVPSEPDIPSYVEYLRRCMKRAISYKLGRGTNTVVAYLLDHKMEERIRSAGGRPLTDRECDEILAAVAAEAKYLPPTAQVPVILTAPDIRPTVREILGLEFSLLQVTSYAELPPDVNVQPIARIAPLQAQAGTA